jgi:hypothetical protein
VRYALFDRGGAVDEYASVPEYRGPLPPGDVVALVCGMATALAEPPRGVDDRLAPSHLPSQCS